jgi:hypothetical protein
VIKEYRRSVGPDDQFDENAPPRPAWQRRRPRRSKKHDPWSGPAGDGGPPPEEK